MPLSAVRASLPARPPDTLPMRKPCRPSWKKWPCLGAPPNTWIEISLHRRRLSRLLRVAHGPILWPPCTTDTTNTPTCSPLKVRHSSLLNISPRHRRNIRAVRLERPVLPVFALGIFWAQALVRKSRCKVTQGLPHSRMLPIQNRLRQPGYRISRLRRPKNLSSKYRRCLLLLPPIPLTSPPSQLSQLRRTFLRTLPILMPQRQTRTPDRTPLTGLDLQTMPHPTTLTTSMAASRAEPFQLRSARLR